MYVLYLSINVKSCPLKLKGLVTPPHNILVKAHPLCLSAGFVGSIRERQHRLPFNILPGRSGSSDGLIIT